MISLVGPDEELDLTLRLACDCLNRRSENYMVALKLRKIGNSIGVVIPSEMLRHLRADVGDTIHATLGAGGLQLTAHDPAFERQMAAMRTVTRKNRNALRELAK